MVKATNLEKLNSAGDDEDPCPTPDNLGLLYSRKGKKYYDIYVSRRTAATAPFAGALRQSAAFQDTMAAVAAVTDATGADFEALKKKCAASP